MPPEPHKLYKQQKRPTNQCSDPRTQENTTSNANRIPGDREKKSNNPEITHQGKRIHCLKFQSAPREEQTHQHQLIHELTNTICHAIADDETCLERNNLTTRSHHRVHLKQHRNLPSITRSETGDNRSKPTDNFHQPRKIQSYKRI